MKCKNKKPAFAWLLMLALLCVHGQANSHKKRRQRDKIKISLHAAVESGNRAAVEAQLRDGAPINSKDERGSTALHIAATHGQVGAGKILLESGAQVDARTKNGWTPLHLAAFKGHIEIAKLLLESGAQVDARTKHDWSPLHIAADEGHIEIAKLLLESGAEVEVQDDKKATPLFIAADNGHIEIAKLLLESGAEVEVQDDKKATLLFIASKNGRIEVAKLLLKKGAIVDAKNKNDCTPLHVAAVNGHVEVVKLLLESGAQVDTRTNKEATPLLLATQNGHIEVVGLLLESGAQVDTKDDEETTPLHSAANNGHVEVVRLLLAKNAQVDTKDDEGATPLLLAAQNDHIEVVKLLLAKNAQVNPKDDGGDTPLHFAAQSGHIEVVKLLLAKNAQVNPKDDGGDTPLHFAAQSGHIKVVKLLLAKNAQVNPKDDGGDTPLHFAAQSGHIKVVRLLLESGARVDTKDDGGDTPLHLAVRNKNVDIIRLLIKDQASVSLTPKLVQVLSNHGYEDKNLIHSCIALKNKVIKELFNAIRTGNVPAVRSLLDLGANINQQSPLGQTVLMLSAQNGNRELVELLVTHDPWVVFVKDDEGNNAENHAIFAGHTEIAEYLESQKIALRNTIAQDVTRGVKPSKFVKRKIDRWLKELSEARAFEDKLSHKEHAVEDSQCAADQAPSFQEITQVRSDINSQEVLVEQQRTDVLKHIFSAIAQLDLARLRQFSTYELDPRCKNEHGDTFLIAAVKEAVKTKRNAARRVVRELLICTEIRQSINEPGSHGTRACMSALGDPETLGFLLEECRATLDLSCLDDQGRTVFMHAAKKASPQTQQALLTFASGSLAVGDLWNILTQRDYNGLTAVMLAAQSGKKGTTEALLRKLESLATSEEASRHVSEQKEYVKQCQKTPPETFDTNASDEDDQKEEEVLNIQQQNSRLISALRSNCRWSELNAIFRASPQLLSLIKKPIYVDGKKTTALHVALKNPLLTQNTFTRLLTVTGNGVVNMQDYEGKQLLDMAIQTKRRGLIKVVLTGKAHVQQRHIDAIEAITASTQNQSERGHWQRLCNTMQKVLSSASEPPEPVKYQSKENVKACKRSERQRVLFKKIIDVNTPLKLAYFKELLSTGLKVDERLEGQMTLLMLAAKAGCQDASEELLKHNASPDLKDENGYTAFAYASQAGHTTLANRLCIAMAKKRFEKKPEALGHIKNRHARRAPAVLRKRQNVKDKPFYIEERRMVNDGEKATRKKCRLHQFPEGWTDQKIQDAIRMTLHSPNNTIQDNHAEIDASDTVIRGTLAVEGVVDGIHMRVVVSNAKEATRWCVFTAYPIPS